MAVIWHYPGFLHPFGFVDVDFPRLRTLLVLSFYMSLFPWRRIRVLQEARGLRMMLAYSRMYFPYLARQIVFPHPPPVYYLPVLSCCLHPLLLA